MRSFTRGDLNTGTGRAPSMKMEYAVTAEVTVTLSIITVRNVTRRSEMHGTIVMAHDPQSNDTHTIHSNRLRHH